MAHQPKKLGLAFAFSIMLGLEEVYSLVFAIIIYLTFVLTKFLVILIIFLVFCHWVASLSLIIHQLRKVVILTL